MPKLEARQSLCASNCADDTFHNSPAAAQHVSVKTEAEVDAISTGLGDGAPVRDGAARLEVFEDEGSSSFGDSLLLEDEEGSVESGRKELEVDSSFGCDVGGAGASDGAEQLFVRKKATSQWRKYISPLMWRCQWLELRMKELLSQASKYEKELRSIKKLKDLHPEAEEADHCISKPMVTDAKFGEYETMKRKKRKKIEDLVDPSSYMKKHHAFSFYENNGLEMEKYSVDDDDDEHNVDRGEDVKSILETRWLYGSKERNIVRQQIYLNDILLSIGSAQSRVAALIETLNKEFPKEERVLTVAEQPSLSENLRNCKDEDQMLSDDEPITSTTISDQPEEDVILEDTEPQNFNNTAQSSNIIKRTAGLLIASNAHIRACSKEETCDDVLINNDTAKEEYQHLGNANLPVEKIEASAEERTKLPANGEHMDALVPRQEDPAIAESSLKLQKVVRKPSSTGRPRGRPRKKRSILIITVNNDKKVPLEDASKIQSEEKNPAAAAVPTLKETVDVVEKSSDLPPKMESADGVRKSLDVAPVLPLGNLYEKPPLLAFSRRRRREVPAADPLRIQKREVPLVSAYKKQKQSCEVPSTASGDDVRPRTTTSATCSDRKRTEKIFVVTTSSSRSGRIRKPKVLTS